MKTVDTAEYLSFITDFTSSPSVLSMRDYCQHGSTSTYEHCRAVAYYSYRFCRRFRVRVDVRSVVRGAMLHDYFLYDWHIPHDSHKLHGFFHAQKALENAKRDFAISQMEADIIESHMWPLTLRRIPRNREAWIVCVTDKGCSLFETFRGTYRREIVGDADVKPRQDIR